MTRSEPPAAARGRALPMLMLLAGTAAATAAWIAIAGLSGGPASWMGLIAAADAAWLLRHSGMPPGPRRGTWAVVATAATIAMATWGIVAGGVGGVIGLGPLDASLKLGTGLAWTLVQLMHGPLDLALLAAALFLAALAGR